MAEANAPAGTTHEPGADFADAQSVLSFPWQGSRVYDGAMFDMLVRLYDLPDVSQEKARLEEQGILVRRPGAYERHLVASWVRRTFSRKWESETLTAFARQPIACYIATRQGKPIGFACYDVTARGFLGPMGVDPQFRGTGLGRVLLTTALGSLREMGYAYGFIGGVGPAEFYAKAVGAVPVEGSTPGIYVDILPEEPED